MQTTTDQAVSNATVWRRFVAMGYETFLLVGPVLLFSFVYTVVTGQTDQDAPDSTAAIAKRMGLQLLVLGILIGYFVWGWSRGKVTLPMQTLQLRVVDAATGAAATPRQALVRALVGTASVITGLWLVVSLLRKDRQTLHDLASGTRLVYARPGPRLPPTTP
jgi:uncharacterized RDD family membrane protein YckC